MECHQYDIAEQHAFAWLSGDHNPLHVDAHSARRFLFGRPVVHGIHSVLRALDSWLADRSEPLRLTELNVVFATPIPLGVEVTPVVVRHDEGRLGIVVSDEHGPVTRIRTSWIATAGHPDDHHLSDAEPERSPCRRVGVDDAAGLSGRLGLCLHRERAARLFPNVMRSLPPLQLAQILATTRLVGMECPGLNSIFSELTLAFGEEDGGEDACELSYAVKTVDPRFALVSISVAASGVQGTIKAFVRPEPRKQPAFSELESRVSGQEFSQQHALVVGGSRGLGEVTAKLLGAGGAKVMITYHRGVDEARWIVGEIVDAGRSADCMALDVTEAARLAPELRRRDWRPTHLYYFATPAIFVARRGKFSARLFDSFAQYYVTGFLETLAAVRTLNPDLARVLYPSTVAIDEAPLNLGEYCAAKVAGESLCSFLERAHRPLRILRPRLPRLATDQTASLAPVDNQDPVPMMLEHLRELG